MSKFTIKLKLQGLELEVEGSKEDAPRIAQRVGQQLGQMLQPTTLLETNNGYQKTIDGEPDSNGSGKKKKSGARKSGGSLGAKIATEELRFVHDSSKFGSPSQEWTGAQKAIWFLWIVSEQTDVKQQTAYGIMKVFNSMFRAAGQINNGNIMKALEKEKLKGATAPVGADTTDGTVKYFLTTSGVALAQRLAKGEALSTE